MTYRMMVWIDDMRLEQCDPAVMDEIISRDPKKRRSCLLISVARRYGLTDMKEPKHAEQQVPKYRQAKRRHLDLEGENP